MLIRERTIMLRKLLNTVMLIMIVLIIGILSLFHVG
jgi:hypothetical protein